MDRTIDGEVEYLRRRESLERRMAAMASCAQAKRAHQALERAYARRRTTMMPSVAMPMEDATLAAPLADGEPNWRLAAAAALVLAVL